MSESHRILAFGWHDRLVALLASLGDEWDVVPRTTHDREAPWQLSRRLPENVTVSSLTRARHRLEAGTYDLIVAQGLEDLQDTSTGSAPTLFIVGGSPQLAQALGVHERLRERLFAATAGPVTPVFLSEDSRQEWDWDGEVLPIGLNTAGYGPFSGEIAKVLVVGKLGRLLPETADVTRLERATAGLPVTWVDSSTFTAVRRNGIGRPWILDAYAQHRVFLDVTPGWCRDGQHLSVLEAMATGQPVVTVPKRSSPVVDGINGFIEADPSRLHMRLLELLGDHALAMKLGGEARRTIDARFKPERLLDQWRDLLGGVARPARVAS